MILSHLRGHATAQALTLLLVALIVTCGDQCSKYLVRANMELNQSIPTEGVFRLTYVQNKGGAFGILGDQTFLLAVVSIIAILFIFFFVRSLPTGSTLLGVGLGLELGGAVGNLIDRVRLGAVTDFIDVGDWPVFNFADSAITVGTVLIVFYLLFAARSKSDGTETPTSSLDSENEHDT
jgi:signal peptidase II